MPSLPLIAALSLSAIGAGPAAPSESHVGTHFQVYAQPNASTVSRASAVVITAQAGSPGHPCIVNLVDDGADGDTDDTQLGVALLKGESLVRYLKDGAVNDDAFLAGAAVNKLDGDYFVIDATLPVSVLLSADSDWEHDWAPSTNGTLRGSEFFLYTAQVSTSNRDIDLFAYEDGTHVEIYDVTSGAPVVARSGVATVGPRPASPILTADLDEGEDLNRRFGLGRDIFVPGHTYQVVATKDVTALFGAIDSVVNQNQARDGAGFVPGRSGHAIDTDFYFAIPHNPGTLGEQELRVVAGAAPAGVTLFGWDTATNTWVQIAAWALAPFGHADRVGGAHDLYHLVSDAPVTVYETNWMETGAATTSDDSDFAPGFFAADGSESFVVYVGPPGDQRTTTTAGIFSHVYLYSYAGEAAVWVRDADTGGGLFNQTVSISPGGYADVRITQAQWTAMNVVAQGRRPYLRIDTAGPVAVEMSNWNDNWMAYATSVLPRNPRVEVVPPPAAAVGSSVTVGGGVTNEAAVAITNVETRVTLPSGLTYLNGTLAGTPEVATAAVPGGTEVTFQLASLQPGQAAPLVVNAVVAASTGQAASVTVSSTAVQQGTSIGQVGSAATRPPASGVATLSSLSAGSGNSVVVLTWEELADPGVGSAVAVQRAAAATGPWTTLAPSARAHTGTGVPSFASFSDTTAVNNGNYYYRVVATGGAGQISTAGPVLGQPRNNLPPPTPTLIVSGVDRAVTVQVGGSATPDLAGYLVERAAGPGGPWSVLTPAPIAGPALVDANLVNGTVVWYRARAVNTSNLSSAYAAPQSAIPGATTVRTSDLVAYFEDMIGRGGNDWDYNDFVVQVSVTEDVSSGQLHSVVIDYQPKARGAGYYASFRQLIPVSGRWTAALTHFAAGAPTVATSRTVTAGTGPADLIIYDDTRDALPPVVGAYANTAPSQVGYQPGANARLELTLLDPVQNPDGAAGAAPWDVYLHLPYVPGVNEVHRGVYGGPSETVTSGPLTGSVLEFVQLHVATVVAPSWAFEGTPVWRAYPDFVPHRLTGDAAYQDWPDRPTSRAEVFDEDHR